MQDAVPIRFKVESTYQITEINGGMAGFSMRRVAVQAPWWKDYPETNPESLAAYCPDKSAYFLAFSGGRLAGAAAGIYGCPEYFVSDDLTILADLRDIRVDPGFRRLGIGRQLFAAIVAWGKASGAKWLRFDTQNINPDACDFYLAMGCRLGGFDRFAYHRFPDEVQMMWYLDLTQ